MDSLAGAFLQERRVCALCGVSTEQRIHECGTATRRVGGLPLDNDAVNLICTATGSIVALALVHVMGN